MSGAVTPFRLVLVAFLLALSAPLFSQHWQYVDPRIGSVGVGRTFPGPCVPFGMVKPGPDCGVLPNAGWAPMPAAVTGFSQTHVSGTGGGQKYGNVLIQPLLGEQPDLQAAGWLALPQRRISEDFALGYYTTTFENGIRTEITTSARCAHYRFHYLSAPKGEGSGTRLSKEESGTRLLFLDATHFLGKDTIPNLRERQQFVGAALRVVGNREVEGYTSVRGGWNNGDAYTVYFVLQADKPFEASTDAASQRACLQFADTLVGVKIGISYVSEQQARKNIDSIDFDEQLQCLRDAWEQQLSKVRLEGSERQKRMFYTALYHTMLMPVDKTGENPKWADAPYYDDYYAIWDTYRTSSPLLTLLDEQREVDIVNSLLNIYKHEGYMPDARSGDCNGRTQGGSNGEVVIADAFVKGVKGIDYKLALEAMLKDAETDPGADHEKHGRGGLDDYRRLGYIPYGVPRAGTRTVEYAFCDYCLAQVVHGLGRTDLYRQYMERSHYWRNLWRDDYVYDGMRGFIMPKDADGQWLDNVPWGHSQVFHPQIPYTPVTKVAPWYLPWWDTFFYEATSQEYSLCVPHDVEALVEACGGAEAFRQRLDRFFAQGYYNVQNEPSFLTPCLYHWIGRPDLSVQRVHQILRDNYSDLPDGLPGNDDSGAMSSWLAFHMLGLYPNAGHNYYLLTLPTVDAYSLTLPNGRLLKVSKAKGDKLCAVFNGRPLTDARISHADLLQGGSLVFYAPDTLLPAPSTRCTVHFTLNRQFRSWPLSYGWQGDTLLVQCKQTTYCIPRSVVDDATAFCWLTPQADGTVYHDVQGTFCFVSRQAYRQLLQTGVFVYDGITWRLLDEAADAFHVQADVDGTEMWIARDAELPLVTRMQNNPLGIDWHINME
ncbi:MAG: GH92 family glycosyl hydrolase [Prevotella sp.]|nr:GH92 family glycosyl hydrolase [Prevotella sp.]